MKEKEKTKKESSYSYQLLLPALISFSLEKARNKIFRKTYKTLAGIPH